MTDVHQVSRAAEVTSGHVLGGGTLLMRQVNYAPQDIDRLVIVSDPELKAVRAEGSDIRIGAGVTMAEVIAHPDLAAFAPAARAIGGPALRNMGTVGGNLFAPHPYGDFATALLAAGAQVHWADGRSEDLEAMLKSRDAARGCVVAVTMPRLRPEQLRFRKLSRTKPKGVSVLSVAVRLDAMGGRVNSARVAFGAMGPTPMRSPSAEQALQGASLDEAGVARACEACVQDLAPADDALASAWYRKRVAPVQLKRVLLEAR
ncbi:FAD binding domain-containing protein [Pseudaestuariivita sp.]|uniref:FAD binding domain-containing protein n=1 Tax=Pseudaestuariivita sp. TaxID=2211669 RepID=UPI004058E7D6